MDIQIIHADVMDGLRQLLDQSVQCVVTSPPYWGLRDYGTGRWEGGDPDCNHEQDQNFPVGVIRHTGIPCNKCWAKYTDPQIGLEKTPEEYVTKMVEVFREVKRVLRDDGTVWLNLGDTYAASRSYQVPDTKHPACDEHHKGSHEVPDGLKQKDMVGIPWRVAFALQADGWYLRSDIIWSKPNPMPESVTDRPTKSHEYVFLLTKKARYFYDADAVREKYSETYLNDPRHLTGSNEENIKNGYQEAKAQNPKQLHRMFDKDIGSGRNRRTVWEIATQPFPAAHFATFPEALVEPCIKAGTSERGCCSVCGAPWVRVVEKVVDEVPRCNSKTIGRTDCQYGESPTSTLRAGIRENNTVGWQPSCSCSADTVPCVVLDPFGGSGTVGKVARDLNRKAILIEINPDYIKIARERLRLNEQLDVFT